MSQRTIVTNSVVRLSSLDRNGDAVLAGFPPIDTTIAVRPTARCGICTFSCIIPLPDRRLPGVGVLSRLPLMVTVTPSSGAGVTCGGASRGGDRARDAGGLSGLRPSGTPVRCCPWRGFFGHSRCCPGSGWRRTAAEASWVNSPGAVPATVNGYALEVWFEYLIHTEGWATAPSHTAPPRELDAAGVNHGRGAVEQHLHTADGGGQLAGSRVRGGICRVPVPCHAKEVTSSPGTPPVA